MGILRQFSFRGLNLRDSEINRPPEYASDLQNVLLNSKKELIKRYGFDEEFSLSGVLDVIEYISAGILVFIKADGIYIESGGSLSKVTFGGASITYSGLVDFDEYNEVLYITDTSGSNFPFKYDEERFYRAGLPQVTVNSIASSATASAGGNFYYRVYFGYRDGKNNYTFGDYYQTAQTNTANNPVFTIDTLNGEQFFNSNSSVNQLDPVGVLIAYSGNETYGYKFMSIVSSGAPSIFTVDHSAGTYAVDTGSAGGLFGAVPLEDFYDPTVLKGLPPKAKYIAIYNSQMLLGNVDASTTIEQSPEVESSIYWSDTGVGSSVETFAPFSTQVIGKTSEGVISGLFSSENEATILKGSQVYYLHGVLVDRAFRITNSLSGGIGCSSHKSIIEAEGGCFFQSSRGIYFAGGGSRPIEISDIIEPLFTEDTTGLDLTKTRAIRDTKRERLLFYIPASSSDDDIVLVYDYYHKEWFKFTGYDAREGFNILSDEIYHCNGSSLFKESTSYNDDGAAISAFYKTSYHHFGLPSLLKKFVRYVIFSVGSLVWDCTVKSQKNWTSTDDTDLDIAFNSSLNFEDKPLNKTNSFSMRLSIENNTIDQGMLVQGYELVYEMNQKDIKGAEES